MVIMDENEALEDDSYNLQVSLKESQSQVRVLDDNCCITEENDEEKH